MAALLLAVAAPILLSLGISARGVVPETDDLVFEPKGELVEDLGYRVRLVHPQGDGTDIAPLHLEIDAREGERIPEVLVYCDVNADLQDELPDSAQFLGPVSSSWTSNYELPYPLASGSSSFSIYFVSLVRDGLVGSILLDAAPGVN